MRFPTIARLLLAASLLFAPLWAHAQAWPEKPVRWIVPFPPGGPTDLVSRLIASKLAGQLGQPVIIENRPGAAGNVGMEAAAKSAPDGYTVVFVVPSVIINPHLYKLAFDPLKDLVPITQVTGISFVMVANPGFAPRTVADIVALAKSKPGTVTCGSAGGLSQFACELLKTLGQINLNHIPYKGNAQVTNDVIGGQVDLMFDVVSTAAGQIKAGKVRPIATTNPRRGMEPFPDLPTVNETLAGFELLSWQGVMAPAGTPRDTVTRLNREIGLALSQPDVRQRLTDAGLEVAPGTPENFGEILRRDYAKYGRIIRDANIKAE